MPSPPLDRVREAFNDVLSALLSALPFIAAPLLRLRVKYVPGLNVVAGIRGNEIVIGDAFMLDPLQSAYRLAHVAMHLILRHRERCEGREPSMCNLAADVVVDDILSAHMRVYSTTTYRLLEGIADPREVLQMSLEELYELLTRHADTARRALLQVTEDLKDVEGGKEEYVLNEGDQRIYGEGASTEEAMQSLAEDVVAYMTMFKTAGTGTPHIEGELARIGRPAISWAALLRRSIASAYGKVRDTWMRPNRRFPDYPGYKHVRPGAVWVLIDTSGSISDDEFNRFMTEVFWLAKTHRQPVNIVEWDAEVQHVVMNATPEAIRRTRRVGYGGTILRPALEYVLNKLRPGDIVVVLSDWDLYDYDDQDTQRLLRAVAYRSRLVMVTTHRQPPMIPTATVIKIS